MKPTVFSRRDMLKLISMGLTSLALDAALRTVPSALAQSAPADTAYADDVALTREEIAQIKAAKLTLTFNMDQLESDYNRLIIARARQVAGDYGLTLTVSDARNNPDAQRASMASQAIDRTFAGIFVLPLSPNQLVSPLRQANELGTPVVMMGGQPESGQLATLLNSTNYLGCHLAATALTQAAGGSGKIAVISYGRDLSAYRDGERGVLDAIAETRMQLVDLVAVSDEPQAESAMAALLKDHPDLTAVFAAWGEALDGVLVALDAVDNNVKVAGFGAEVASFNAFADNDENLIAVSAERGAEVGRAAIDVLCKAILKQPIAAEVFVPTLLVTSSNYRTRWSELYPDRAEPWQAEATATPTAS